MNVEFLSGHDFEGRFHCQDNVLCAGDRRIDELARSIGEAPFYVYDRRIIREQVAALRKCLPPTMHIHYAVKANPMPEVVAELSRLVDGLDVASAREMRVALNSGVDPDTVSFAGPGKRVPELEAAIAAGITLNVESHLELQRIVEISRNAARRARVAIRVNPDFQLKTSGMKMGGGPQQFGIDAELVPAMLGELAGLNVEFAGLHIFSGSQNLRSDAIVEAQQKTIELAIELAAFTPSPMQTLNIGGGFGIPYFPGDQPLDLAPISENLHRLAEHCERALPGTTLVTELGRYLVGECGLYVANIVDKKISRGKTFLITDGGLHHHLAASGNFGQVIRKNYPVCIGNRITGDTEKVTIVGPLCTPLDVLASTVGLPAAEVGDLVVVFQSGAYGLSASPLGFLSHPAPSEVIV